MARIVVFSVVLGRFHMHHATKAAVFKFRVHTLWQQETGVDVQSDGAGKRDGELYVRGTCSGIPTYRILIVLAMCVRSNSVCESRTTANVPDCLCSLCTVCQWLSFALPLFPSFYALCIAVENDRMRSMSWMG